MSKPKMAFAAFIALAVCMAISGLLMQSGDMYQSRTAVLLWMSFLLIMRAREDAHG